MPDTHVLLAYLPESDAHTRRIRALAEALRAADIGVLSPQPGSPTDSLDTLFEGVGADWMLIIWSPGMARLFDDTSIPIRHAVLSFEPIDNSALPEVLRYAPRLILDGDDAMRRLIDRLTARASMAPPPEASPPPPPPPPAPAPSRGGGAGGALGPPRDIEKEEIKKMGEPSTGSGAYGPHVPDPGIIYPVWYGTNRKPEENAGFSGDRYYKTLYGRVDVRIPEAHRFGEIGTSFWKRLLRMDLRDDRLRIQEIVDLEHDACYQEIHAALQAAFDAGNQPHALLFIHGFNVTFDEAAIRAAQIGYDLKVPGPTAFFSWPSKGDVHRYKADEASIEASEQAITEFLVDFAAQCQGAKIHLIAHSMGNRGFLRALQRIAANAAIRGKVWFDQIFLAAPDVDRDLFLQLAHLYPEHAGRTTLYASNGDLPVFLSGKLHEAPRAGYFRPYTIAPGIDTIAVPDFDVDLLGHSYYAQAEALLYDIQALMRHNPNPPDRPRMHDALDEGKPFWKLGL